MPPLTVITKGKDEEDEEEEISLPPPPNNPNSSPNFTSIQQEEIAAPQSSPMNMQELDNSTEISSHGEIETDEANESSSLIVSPNSVHHEDDPISSKSSKECLEKLDEMLARTRWIVPVLPDQELQTLLRISISLASKDLDKDNEHIQKFLRDSLTTCFSRLMSDDAVKEWKQEIHKHIFDCASLFVDLCVCKINDESLNLLDLLALIFNPRNKYHSHNSHKSADNSGLQVDGVETAEFAHSPPLGTPKGWLVLLINRFGVLGGFKKIVEKFESENLSCATICAILRPFGQCNQFLTSETVQKYFSHILEISTKYMQNLSDDELKKETKGDARENNPIELVRYIRNLTARIPGRENIIRELERLRLKTILRTLQMSSFAGKMNALNEINRVMTSSLSNQDEALLTSEEVVHWLRDNDLLGVAIRENLHIYQYVEKLERILRFMIKEKALSATDLDLIWAAQTGKHDAIVKNVHDLLAKLAWDFTGDQLDHLFHCFQENWREASKKQREKLLELIRRLAEDDKEGHMAEKVLTLLWNLALDPDITTDIMDQALACHVKILDYSGSVQKDRDRMKLVWLSKCIDEIRKDTWIMPAMKHFRDICLQYSEPPANSTYPQWPNVTYRNTIVSQLQSEYSLVAVVSASLVKYIERVRSTCSEETANATTLKMDGRFEHCTQISKRLSFLKFLLRDGQLWLCEIQAKQIWDCLIVAPVFASDRESGFRWFGKMMDEDADLDPNIWRSFFEQKVLVFDAYQLTESGMICFERFFKHVNQSDGRLMTDGGQFVHINNFDMIGQEYLWRVVMHASEPIADRAIELLREVFGNPSSEMMEKLNQLHTDFIQSCLNRLRASYDTLSVLTGGDKDVVNQIRAETTRMTRVLRVLRGYVTSYDEQYNDERAHLPMYRACAGRTLSVNVQFQAQNVRGAVASDSYDFVTHSNETLGDLRRIVANELRTQSGVRVELYLNSELLDRVDDRKLLHELGLVGRVLLQGKIQHNRSTNNGSSPDSSGESSGGEGSPPNERMSRSEMESLLPSTWMCRKPEVVEFLLHIAEMGAKLSNEHLRDGARTLLRLIPCGVGVAEKVGKILSTAAKNSSATTNPLQSIFFSPTPSEVVYYLELVYCLLVPARETDAEATAATRSNFVKAGGLDICLSTLLQNNFLTGADPYTKSVAFYWALRLSKLLLNVTAHQKLDAAAASVKIQTAEVKIQNLDSAATKVKSAEMVVLQSFLTSNVGVQQDVLFKNVCKNWAEQIKDYPVRRCLELPHAKIVLKIAWAAATGNFSTIAANADELHNACAGCKQVSVDLQELCREALEVLTFCIVLTPSLVESLMKEKMFQLCIVDLMFSSNQSIRQVALEQFYAVATKSYLYLPKIMNFFIVLLFTETHTKANEHFRICREFFYLLRSLLCFAHSVTLQISNLDKLLDNEIEWLKSVREHTVNSLESYPDDCILEGHLLVAKELVSFLNGAKKYEYGAAENGPCLIKALLEEFLLPSSRMYVEQQKTLTIQRSATLMESISSVSTAASASTSAAMISNANNSSLPRSNTTIYSPRRCVPVCGTPPTVSAAFDLVVALCTACVENMQLAVNILTEMFYHDQYGAVSEWDYAPPVNLRNTNVFVGLKNAGATCYMNSVLQQLFTVEPLREAILNADPEGFDMDESDNEDTFPVGPSMISSSSSTSDTQASGDQQKRREYHVGVLRCLQLIFANLLGSQLQYYVPKKFWKHFKFVIGETINLREQHDALEFFNKVVDSVDEALKALGQPEICSKFFGGTFADQKICKDCPHRYTREEPFNTLSLDVRNQNSLLDSLQEYVKGDLLESENAYFCEKCNKKVDAIKRLCIKKLPPILAIQLKRFDFDWEREVAVKFHDFFQFPRQIDMRPFTVAGLAKLDGDVLVDGDDGDKLNDKENESTQYRLRGIVVHSGQANGGHYFSFILHKFPNGTSKWFKFDDCDVSEYRLDDDEELKNQCFGGEYYTDAFDTYYRRMQKRQAKRWWNGYMLFYERVDDSDTLAVVNTLESMSISTRLRQMPSRLENIVRRKNMKCVHERNQYTPEYFTFVRNLCLVNVACLRNYPTTPLSKDLERLALLSVQIMSKFLFSTGFRAKRSLQISMNDWFDVMSFAFRCSALCRLWFAQEVLYKHPNRFVECFFESPNVEVRMLFGKIVIHLAHFSHQDAASSVKCIPEKCQPRPNESLSDMIIRTLLHYATKDASSDSWVSTSRHAKEYFTSFYVYATLGLAEKKQLLMFDVPMLFLKFAWSSTDGGLVRTSYSSDYQRLYGVVSLLVRCCDTSAFYATNGDDTTINAPNPFAETEKPLTIIPAELGNIIFVDNKYVKRLLDEPLHNEDTTKLLKFCCWENWKFSQMLIDLIIQNVRSTFTEFRPILELLLHILTISDSWSEKRCSTALKGDDCHDGVFKMIQIQQPMLHARRCYQIFKSLVALFHHSLPALNVLKDNDDMKTVWNEAADWLQNELSKKSYQSQYPGFNQWSPPYQSNDNGAGGSVGLSRTPSAKMTLTHVRTIANEYCRLPVVVVDKLNNSNTTEEEINRNAHGDAAASSSGESNVERSPPRYDDASTID